MNALWQDMRYGARTLLKKPGFTSIAVTTLALGIGANTMIFSVVNAVLLRPLPYAESDRLMWVTESGPDYIGDPIPGPDFLDWSERSHSLTGIAAYTDESLNLTGAGDPDRLLCGKVTADFFALLGVAPLLGRAFLPVEDSPGGARVVMMSYGLWQRRFGADPSVLGNQLALNGESYTVIGVLPPAFRFHQPFELWLPLALDPASERKGERVHLLDVIARLKPGVSAEQAEAEMETLLRQSEQAQPRRVTMSGARVNFTPLQKRIVGEVRLAMLVLLGAVGFVLLIACANVANLLLARAIERRREMAVRAALGASRWRLIRQLLVESLLLALAGGALGTLLALWGVDLLVKLSPSGLTGEVARVARIAVDNTALGFTLAASILTGLLFGLAPALAASGVDLIESLKDGARRAAPRALLRRLLVVGELALALTLLVGAGLLVKSFLRLRAVETGFNPQNLLAMRISLPLNVYREGHQRTAYFQQLLARIEQLPGAHSAGIINHPPLVGEAMIAVVSAAGAPAAERKQMIPIGVASADYFRTMGIPLLAGRVFSDSDIEGAPPVTVISQSLARRSFPGQDPLGKQLRGPMSLKPLTVVGVVGDVRRQGLAEAPAAEIYLPYQQARAASMTLMIRADRDPINLIAAARAQALAVDRDQPIYDARTMEDRLAELVAPQRFNLFMLSLFAALALSLAAIGVYGVMAYSVTQRTHEIGVRVALGAQSRDVLRLVMKQGMTLALIGVAIGLIISLALTRLMKGLLFGVSATDPMTFIVIALSLTVVALLACWLPARRAARVDPMVALKYE
jgi:putative ABC transport system permease protein